MSLQTIIKEAADTFGAGIQTGAPIKSDYSTTGIMYSDAVGGTEKKTLFKEVEDWAVRLVTGADTGEWKQIKEVKKTAKAAQEKLDQYYRLIKYGASPDLAAYYTGVMPSELGAEDGDKKDSAIIAAVKNASPLDLAAYKEAEKKANAEAAATGSPVSAGAGLPWGMIAAVGGILGLFLIMKKPKKR